MNIENTWLKYGLMFGGFSILSSLIFYYVMPIGVFTEGFISIIAMIVFMILAVREERKNHDIDSGFPFGTAFSTAFFTGFLGTVISTLFAIILFQLIDPSLVDVLTERTIEATESLMAKMNVPEDQLQSTIEQIETDMAGKFSPISLLQGLFFSGLILAVIAAIIALVFKKEPRIA
ncbi:MAG: DUF4199 domain-containing protein [Saprospiraceae bacterium]